MGIIRLQKMTYAAYFVWAIFIFTSFSVSALGHILILVPGFYFLYEILWKRRENIPPSAWALLALFIFSALSVVMNSSEIARPFKNFFKTKYFLFSFIGGLALYGSRDLFNSKNIRKMINTFMVTTTIASLTGIIALYSGYHPLRLKAACHTDRACGMYGMYMSYGYGISLFCILLLGVWIYRKELKEYMNEKILWAALPVNLIGLYLSFGRGAWIGFAAAAPFFFLKKNKKVFFGVIGGVLIASALAFGVSSKVRDIFTNPSRLYSNAQRIAQYKTAVKAFQESPIFGIGYRNFEPNVPALKKKYNIEHQHFAGHAHSNFFEHLASTGLLGLIAILAFHFLWFFEAYKRDDLIAALSLPFVVGLFISGQFQYTIGDGENLFLILGLYSIFMASGIHAKRA